jgi:hypothetical protein
MNQTISGLPVPTLLAAAMASGQWPTGRVPPARLRSDSPFLDGMHFEFAQSVPELFDNKIASTRQLLGLADSSQAAAEMRLGRSNACSRPLDLPWLDVEKVIVIGGGADYGDDLWVALDYRTDAGDPRVVANEYVRVDDTRRPECFWREIAPTFSEFCARLGLKLT